MKLSISLAPADVVIIDEYVRTAGLSSRSAAVQAAVRLLTTSGLEDDYAQAWQEWEDDGGEADWEVASGDGLVDASR